MPPQLLPDVQAAVTAYLAGHADLRAVLPAHPLDPATANVGPEVQGPYPCLRVVATPAGSELSLRHRVEQELLLEAWGAPQQEGDTSPAELLRVLRVAQLLLATATELDGELVPGVVLSAVTSSQPGTYLPDPTGQPRYLAGVVCTAHAA